MDPQTQVTRVVLIHRTRYRDQPSDIPGWMDQTMTIGDTSLSPSMPSSTICDRCCQIDFPTALSVTADEIRESRGGGILLDRNVSRLVGELQSDCVLCKVLSSVICWYHDYWSDPATQEELDNVKEFDLRAYSFLRNSPWAGVHALQGAQDSHLLLATPYSMWSSNGDHSRECARTDMGYVVCLPKDAAPGLFCPQVVPERFDPDKAKLWIDTCAQHHGGECQHTPSPIVQGMKLIDCESNAIVLAVPEMQWVALSYVWGPQSKSPSAGVVPSHLPASLSPTIQDAITVTKSLGYRYLWIDRYCINQSDHAEVADQVQRMDLIYRGADLVIIVAAGQDERDGIPGVGQAPREKQTVVELNTCTILTTGPEPTREIRHSRWWTRGWTFQEGLLARRRLVFTPHQMFYECSQASWSESVGGLEWIGFPESINWEQWKGGKMLLRDREPSWEVKRTRYMPSDVMATLQEDELRKLFIEDSIRAMLVDWNGLIKEYTRRQLSFDEDSLNAFSGAIRLLEYYRPDVVNISGIPISTFLDFPEFIELYFLVAVCWVHASGRAIRRRTGFPSWSWVGWEGSLYSMFPIELKTNDDGSDDCRPKWKDILLEYRGNQKLPLCDFVRMRIEKQRHEPDEVTAIHFHALEVPDSLFLFNERRPGDGRDDTGSRLQTVQQEDELSSTNGGNVVPTSASPAEDDEGSETETEASNSTFAEENNDQATVDPDDWANWTIGKHRFLPSASLPGCTPSEFLEQLRNGNRSCLLIGDYHGNNNFTHHRMIMIVEWQNDQTATRVGSLALDQHAYQDVLFPEFFGTDELKWRQVRLV